MKTQFKAFKCVMLISIVGISGMASHSVLADNAKTIPGMNCRDLSNQDEVSNQYGYIRNNINAMNWVTCPIVRDNMAAQSQHFTESVKIRLYKNTSAATACLLYSIDQSGISGTVNYGFVSGTGFQTLSIPRSIYSYTSGLMTIECRLGSLDDRIYGISYNER